MVDRGIALQPEEYRDFDCTVATDPRQIVAQQIDDHQILGSILLAGRQFLGKRPVFGECLAARPRSLDWPGLHMSPAQLEETLGRGRDDGDIAMADEGGEGCRVAPA